MAVFRYANSYGFKASAVKADVFAAELDKIRNDGEVTPAAVVAAARPKRSPMHGLFEWDNTIAAEAWRLRQARQAIISLTVEVEQSGAVARALIFTHEPEPDAEEEPGDGAYVRPSDMTEAQIARVKSYLRSVVEQARASLRQFERLTGPSEKITRAKDALRVVDEVAAA